MNWLALRDWLVKDYDFYKRLIVIPGAVSFVLLGLFLFQWKGNKDLVSAIESGERDLKSLYQTATQISSIRRELKEDTLSGPRANISAYINSQAFDAAIGGINILEKINPGRGFEDRDYTVTLAEKDRFLDRKRIARFLHLIEANTTRARVTALLLKPPRGINRGERREDEWAFEAKVTSRRRK